VYVHCETTAKEALTCANKAGPLTSFLSKAMVKKALTCAEYSLTDNRIQPDRQQNTT
jgi:hypothetical protein